MERKWRDTIVAFEVSVGFGVNVGFESIVRREGGETSLGGGGRTGRHNTQLLQLGEDFFVDDARAVIGVSWSGGWNWIDHLGVKHEFSITEGRGWISTMTTGLTHYSNQGEPKPLLPATRDRSLDHEKLTESCLPEVYLKGYNVGMQEVAGGEPYRRRLHEVALDNHGYVTTKMAQEAGVPGGELPKLAEHGGLERVGYGLYRFNDIPAGRLDQYMEVVLRVGEGAYLVGESVLAMHGLALVNPRRLKVATRRRVRVEMPEYVEVVKATHEAGTLTTHEGIPSTTVAQALVDCRRTVMRERLVEAAHEARKEGLLARREEEEVLARLLA